MRLLILAEEHRRIEIAESIELDGVMMVLAYVKLVWWTDPVTLLCGSVGGSGHGVPPGPVR